MAKKVANSIAKQAKKKAPAKKKAAAARPRPGQRPTGANHLPPKADAPGGSPERGPFDPPEILGDVGAAKWRELAPLMQGLLDRQGQPLLDLVTRDLLASYCVAWESLVEANEELRTADDKYFPTRGGGLTPHPAFTIRKGAQAELRIAGKLLGLNPDARQKIKPKNAAASKDNPVAAILGV